MANARLIHDIARDAIKHGATKLPAAVPYLEAMLSLGVITDKYGYDSGFMIVGYFLCNVTGWRGPDARRIKAELREMLK